MSEIHQKEASYFDHVQIHYPTLKKSSAQNIAACENQSKQHEFIDH